MYDSIHLSRFRQFENLTLRGLTRVNLFVGRNNAGKTSLLEAIELLASGGTPAALLRSGQRRGETSMTESTRTSRPIWRESVDVSHLFVDHLLREGTSFELQGTMDSKSSAVRCEVQVLPGDLFSEGTRDSMETGPLLALRVVGALGKDLPLIPLSPSGVVLRDSFSRQPSSLGLSEPQVFFLGTEGVPLRTLAQLWDKIVVTPEEDKVIAAIKMIEPSIDRLVFLTEGGNNAVVKLAGTGQRVPLGSLGDGTRRMLALAVGLAHATDGVLLIDEIDTGLHYSALESMWKRVVETARRLNIQIFATSHSGDCMRALAWLQADDPDLAADISVHRIEKGATEAVRYSAEELEIAAQHHIEVRG
ncbi:MAG: ATP-binding protein [Myxococcales bacterium]|nr:ATP-binding protein [Myxococcales bacterium]HRC57192.1 ATP-binding protein [Kofleriaceae bacterium]